MTANVLGQALFGLAALGGVVLMLVAGRREAHGEIRTARRAARRAGFLVAAGAALEFVVAVASGVSGPSPSLTAVSAVAILVSGAAGLLGGLSGKPRPAGGFALVFLLAGWIAAVAAQ